MNPDKLFDYLDGKLTPADRTALEEKLMSDAQLRAQFQIAREIHRTGGVSREMVQPVEDPAEIERGGRLGRRILIGAIVLVFANVFIGLGVIAFKSKKPAAVDAREAEIRRQLAASLGAAAQNAMPAPSLSDDVIALTASKTEWDNLSASIGAAAEACGGSALKDASDAGVTMTVSLPRARVAEFRQRVLGPNSASKAASTGSGETATIQIHIAEPAQ